MKGPLPVLDLIWLLQTTLLLLLTSGVPPVYPIISNKYMTFYIPEYSRRYIYLEGKFSYSVQLVLHKGDHDPTQSYWSTRSSTSNNGSITDTVEFIIKAPEYAYYGIMAIVQSLHFRTNPFASKAGHGCRDYIQFSAEGSKGFSDKDPSPKICGTLPRGDRQANPERLLHGSRTYFNPKGSIKLRVHVDQAVSHEDLAELNTIGAEIVFTAYTACPGTEVGLQTLRPCSTSTIGEQPQRLSCIHSALFCDSKIDCGFSSEFALDEEFCYLHYIYIAVGLIVLALVLLVIYGFIHWVREKTKGTSGRGQSSQADDNQGADPGMSSAVESVDMDASMGAF